MSKLEERVERLEHRLQRLITALSSKANADVMMAKEQHEHVHDVLERITRLEEMAGIRRYEQ